MKEVREAVVFLIALVLSVAVHEFGHALVADRLGDRTPRSEGRVTLNPLVHADPIGTLLFPIIAFFTHAPLLGWGRPVHINPAAFTRKMRVKTGHLLVAIFGPLMNVGLALVVTGIYALLVAIGAVTPGTPLAGGIEQVIFLNWVLAFFNMLPLPPLDGGAVLAGVLPDRHDNVLQFLEQYGFIILIGLLITGVLGYFLIPAAYVARFFIGIAVGAA